MRRLMLVLLLLLLLLFWDAISRTGPESINRRRGDCLSTDSCAKCALKSLELPGGVRIHAADADRRGLFAGVFRFVTGCSAFSLSSFNL
jgi:hypothetical protein